MGKARSESPSGMESLLPTKLMPPRLHSAVIRREDLLRRLDEGLEKKLILVFAPTGYGKTTLVSQWLAEREFPSAWVTLDSSDNDPSRFWTYIVSALRTLDSSFGKSTLSLLMSPQLASFQALLTPLLNDLRRLKEPSLLVLEDYHSITSKEINEGISFLLQHLPDSLHILFITRNEPDLPIPLLRARDELVEINAADLRFTQEETQAFLQMALHTELPSSTIASLQGRTEGWAAGLRLVALSLRNKSGYSALENTSQSFSGSDRYVADYLIQEVFESQPEAIQSFLLRTCFFNRLTGSLCDAITGANNSNLMLERLERDNLFITELEHGADQAWYRYNPLFSESVQYLAKQQLSEADIHSLYEKASAWYEYRKLYDEAIKTALAAKLFERAAGLIETFVEIHELGEMLTLSRWLENIPRAEILLHPTICFTYAQVILYSTDRFALATSAQIEPFLHAAESAWRGEENHQRLGELLSFRGTVFWWQGNLPKAFEFARQALEELPEYDVFWRGNSLLILGYEALNAGQILAAQDVVLEARALLGAAQNIYGVLAATQLLSEISYWQGELEQAEEMSQQIVTEAVGDESMLDDQGFAALSLSHIAYERNELERAEPESARALELGTRRANELLILSATIQQAHIHAARGDLDRAVELVKSVEAKVQNRSFLRELKSAQALFCVRKKDLSVLTGWVNMISSEDQSLLHVQEEREAFTLARLHIEEGKADEAHQRLASWIPDAAQKGRVHSQVEGLCLEALAYYLDANLVQATKSLIGALTIAEPKGFRRIFLDEGSRMAALLQAVAPTLHNRRLSLYAMILLHSFNPDLITQQGVTPLVEPLSQQEIRVLRLLAAGLSNTDIAQELVLSTNTVKTHVKNIYRKLNIRSRKEARQAARELRLL